MDALAQVCCSRGAQVSTVLGDLRESPTLNRLAEAVADAGALDGFVFAAGYAIRGGIDSVTREATDRVYEAMPSAFLLLIQGILPQLRARGGHVVIVSAFSAHVPNAGGHLFTASSPAKAALEAAARSLAVELAPCGIPVNSVSPGYIRKNAPEQGSSLSAADWARISGAIPMGRLGEPDDVAAVIAFLLSREAAYMTGQTVSVDGGLTL
jgi:NAD(P)-dependent dehydrogenase (short-subunit alcohol dehydrogenase family)